MYSDALLKHKSLFLAIYMQLGVVLRTLHISHAQLIWYISNIMAILTILLYAVMDSHEISFCIFIIQSFNFGWVFCPDKELLPKFGESWQGNQDTQDTLWCTIYASIKLFYSVNNRKIHNKY